MKYLVFTFLLMSILIQMSFSMLPLPFRDRKNTRRATLDSYKPSNEEIEDSITVAKRNLAFEETFENTIKWASRIDLGTPTHGLFLAHEPEWRAIERGRQALLATKASEQLAYSCCHETGLNFDKCSNMVADLNFLHTSINESCSYLHYNCSHEENIYKYRYLNGTCNHINKGSTGASFTAYERLITAKYLDNYENQRRSITKKALPSPRKISSSLVSYKENLHPFLTLAFSQFGEFIEQDLSNFAASVMIYLNDSFSCCDMSGFDMAPRYKHSLCMPIPVPLDDKYYAKKRIECMSYARSLPAMRSDCSMGYLDQQNQATHFLDGSQIYGTTIEKSLNLRSSEKGKLETVENDENSFLTLSPNPKERCQVDTEYDVCFDSGDKRVNLHPQLTIMYTLWVREHNRIAQELSKINKNWDNEELFQEARKIVIAEMQHITYSEWLKYLLGRKYLDVIGKFSRYNENVNPSISNSFAAAAIRSIYSMFPGNISLIDENRTETSFIKMKDHFNNPGVITKETYFDALVRGLATQNVQKLGLHYSKDFTTKFLADDNYGYDILSLDIQRGRDHGLPSYTSYRQLCSLQSASTFKDFEDVMTKENAQALAQQYQHVDDVDLLIGGLLEKPVKNSVLGPTFSCIIGDQFLRSKRGDRFFYTNNEQQNLFTSLQLAEIKKVSLARIFCDNSNIKTIQAKVFQKISDSNPLMNCTGDNIPRINLSYWNSNRETYVTIVSS